MTIRDMAGFADPEDDGWQERALARVHERQKKSRKGRRTNGITLFYEQPFRVLLDAAAERRGITMNGYARRAIAAMIAHDLGVPMEVIGQSLPGPTPYGVRNPGGRTHKGYDDMQGYGDWNIRGIE